MDMREVTVYVDDIYYYISIFFSHLLMSRSWSFQDFFKRHLSIERSFKKLYILTYYCIHNNKDLLKKTHFCILFIYCILLLSRPSLMSYQKPSKRITVRWAYFLWILMLWCFYKVINPCKTFCSWSKKWCYF